MHHVRFLFFLLLTIIGQQQEAADALFLWQADVVGYGRISRSPTTASKPVVARGGDNNDNTIGMNGGGDENDDDGDVVVRYGTVPSSIEGDPFAIPIKTYSPAITTNSNGKHQRIRAAIFFVHGGIFSLLDRESHPGIARALAGKLGADVITASFRCGEEAPHRTGVTMRDLRDVIDYWRGAAGRGGDDDVPFGLVGSSSGGHFALTLAQTLGPTIVQFCVGICPVAHPYRRAAYLRSCIAGTAESDGHLCAGTYHDPGKASFILGKQLGYWGVEVEGGEDGGDGDDDMRAAGEYLARRREDVPTLVITGSVDRNVPITVVADVMSWATRTVVLGGRGHELCDELVEGGGYHCYLSDIDRFLDFCSSKEE